MNNILVTPSYAPDFERCQAMVESCEALVSNMCEHWLIVDRDDMELFKHLQTPRTRIICKNDLLPVSLQKIPGQKRWWLRNWAFPVRGWILQQVIKLAAAKSAHSDSVIFADSDLLFVRPLDANDLWENNQLRLFKNNRRPHQFIDKRHLNWYHFACSALNMGNPFLQSGAYISQLTSMHPSYVKLLCHYLEERYHRPWYNTLLSTWDFSEFVLYGIFVEKMMATSSHNKHFFSNQEICLSSWFYDLKTQQDVANFIDQRKPFHKAVHLQSNLKLESTALNEAIEADGI